MDAPDVSEASQAPSRVVQQFLNVYELLLAVFSHSDSHTTATAARSARILSNPALDVLWRVVPRASFLFSILSPLDGATSYDGHSSRRFDFDRDLHPEDWERFLPYSRRVEEIVGMEDAMPSDRWNEPSHKALAKFSTSRPPELTLCDIFPRLKRVTWAVYSPKILRNLNIFLVPSLEMLEIKIDNVVELKPMVAFLKQLKSRSAKSLRELRLNTDFTISAIEEEVVDALKAMKNLEKLTIPRFWINEHIFSALANMPSLQYIGQRKAYWWGNSDDTEAGLLPAIEALDRGSFPALREITYDTLNLFEAKKLFGHVNSPKNLTSLCVTSSRLETPLQLHDFLVSLATGSPGLTEIDVGLTFQITEEPGPSNDVTVATLQPLHDLGELTHFGLATHFPIKMNDDDLEMFTEGWTKLKVLWLNETPAYAIQREMRSELSFRALRIMAKNCPNIEELSMFVDATAIPEEKTGRPNSVEVLKAMAAGGEDDGLPTFKKLRYLNLGVSHIASSVSAANYITECLATFDDESDGPPPASIQSPLSPAVQEPLPPLPLPSSSSEAGPSNPSPPRTPSPPTLAPQPNTRPKIRQIYFDSSPRFWPAPVPSPELELTLLRRRDAWDDVGKMIPALLEQKVGLEMMRKEMAGLLRDLMGGMSLGDSGNGLLKLRPPK